MGKLTVKKPERLDELPDQFIYYASRNDSYFKNRSMKIFDWTKEIETLFAEIRIPANSFVFLNQYVTMFY